MTCTMETGVNFEHRASLNPSRLSAAQQDTHQKHTAARFHRIWRLKLWMLEDTHIWIRNYTGVRFLAETDGLHLKAIVTTCRQAQTRDPNCILTSSTEQFANAFQSPMTLQVRSESARHSLRLVVRWRRKLNERTSGTKAPKANKQLITGWLSTQSRRP